MERWASYLKADPVPRLVGSPELALALRARTELLGEEVDLAELHSSRPVVSLLKRQRQDGRWAFKSPRTVVPGLDNNDQVETYRNLGTLVEMYALRAGHDPVRKAAEFLLAHQTTEGDVRGIYGHQYAPNYTAGMLELMIKAGMGNDERVRAGLDWLLSFRQEDGGWAVPLRTRAISLDAQAMLSPPVAPDRSRPSSHMVTGVVLRALASHTAYRERDETRRAAFWLMSRLFKKDNYPDRGGRVFWERTSFPFWFTDIISALDTLTLLGFGADRREVRSALEWLRERQLPDGTFGLGLLKGAGHDAAGWQAFAAFRVFKRA
jgi:hypothetical protein